MTNVAKFTDCLSEFAKSIGVDLSELKQAEKADYLRFTKSDLNAKFAKNLGVKDLAQLTTVFGDSITAVWSTGGLQVLELSQNHTESDLTALRECADDMRLEFQLEVDKAKLIRNLGYQEVPRRRIVLYFFTDAFEALLANSLNDPSKLEKAIWKTPSSGKANVVFCDSKLSAHGPLLALVGHDELDGEFDALEVSGTANPAATANAVRATQACQDAVRWEHPWCDFLTPFHFKLEAQELPSSRITELLNANACNLALLFTADRIRKTQLGFTAHFAADNQQCQIRSIASNEVASGFDSDSASKILDIAIWVYQDQWQSDRLKLLQVVCTRMYSKGTQPHSIIDLMRDASIFDADVTRHWKTFLSEAVDRYVTEEAELENEAAEAVSSFDSQVAEMIASLSSTMLAAVGVLIGSIIAAAFKDKFNVTVFQLGVISYMVYLALFPGLYNMSHHTIRFKSGVQIFERRRRRFDRLLGADETKRIVGDQLARAKTRFWVWFGVTILALIVVLILAGISAKYVPPLFAGSSSTTVPPAATGSKAP